MKKIEKLIARLHKLEGYQLEGIIRSLENERACEEAILESLSTALIIIDTDFNIIRTNKAAERLFFHGKKVEGHIFKLMTESDGEIASFILSSLKDGALNSMDEFSIDSTNGTRFFRASLFSYVRDFSFSGTVIKIDDITEERLRLVLQNRIERMQSLTSLAASVAHEIKNPLGAMSIHLQLLERVLKKEREAGNIFSSADAVEERIDVLKEEISNLNSIVMNFLYATRPVNAHLRLETPEEVIKNVIAFFSVELQSSNIELSYIASLEKRKLMIDTNLFKSVLTNVIQNALQAIKSRQSETKEDFAGEIRLYEKCNAEGYTLSIFDNGCGMKKEEAAKIFEPYYTTKASGTGLGMTMAYKIMREMSGDIKVKSKEGSGTCVVLSLPVPTSVTPLLN